MKKMKFLSALLSVSLLASILSGCGGSDDDGSTGGGDSGVDKTVIKVQFIGKFSQETTTDPISGETKKGVEVLEDEFERLNPDIDVQYILMGWDDYQKKTQSMLLAGEADLYQAPGIAAVASQGLLEPLTPYIEKDSFDLDVYIDGQVDGWKVQGPDDTEPTIYGLPVIGDTRVIMYDKKLFDDFGVEYLSDEPTVEEILEKANQLTGTNPVTGEKVYGIIHNGKDAGDTVMNLNEYYGGTWGTGMNQNELLMNFNSETMVKAVNTLSEINALSPEGAMTGQGGETFGTPTNNVAIHLRCNPEVLSNVSMLGLEEQYGVSRLFINEEEGMGGLFAGSPMVMAANSENKDAAWEYMKFTGSEFYANYMWENQRYEGLPTTKAILNHEDIKDDENLLKLFSSMEYLWTPRYSYRAGQGRYTLSSAVEDIVLNNIDTQTRLDSAQKEIEEWIEIQ